MKTIEYTRRILPGKGTELIYSIVVEEILDPEGLPLTESYGIMVSAGENDEKCVRGITVNRDEIFRLADMISEGTVTPTTLIDIILDNI